MCWGHSANKTWKVSPRGGGEGGGKRPTQHVNHPDLPGMTDVSWSGEQMILKNNQISSLSFWSITQNFASKKLTSMLNIWNIKWILLFWCCVFNSDIESHSYWQGTAPSEIPSFRPPHLTNCPNRSRAEFSSTLETRWEAAGRGAAPPLGHSQHSPQGTVWGPGWTVRQSQPFNILRC